MIKEGLAWIDSQPLADEKSTVGVYAKAGDEGKVYWFPSIMEKKKQDDQDLVLISANGGAV